MIEGGSSLVDVAFAVCTALDRDGITAVLTGGSAATFYAPEAYQSEDADFVLSFDARPSDARNRFTVACSTRPLSRASGRLDG
jgi:hypothetical protein